MSYQLPADDAAEQPVAAEKEPQAQDRPPVDRVISQMKLIEAAAADTVPPVPTKQPVEHSDLGDDRKDLLPNQYENNTFDIDAGAGEGGYGGPGEIYERRNDYQLAEADYGRSFKANRATVGQKKPLNFKIFAVTSQDHEYPALDLVEQLSDVRNTGKSRFWNNFLLLFAFSQRPAAVRRKRGRRHRPEQER